MSSVSVVTTQPKSNVPVHLDDIESKLGSSNQDAASNQGNLTEIQRHNLISTHTPVLYMENSEQYRPMAIEEYTNQSSMYKWRSHGETRYTPATQSFIHRNPCVCLSHQHHDIIIGGKEVVPVGHIKDIMNMHIPEDAFLDNSSGRVPADYINVPPTNEISLPPEITDKLLTGQEPINRVALNFEGISSKGALDPPNQATVDDAPIYVTVNEFMSKDGKNFCTTKSRHNHGDDDASHDNTFDVNGNWQVVSRLEYGKPYSFQ
jgi:hypothetical protein